MRQKLIIAAMAAGLATQFTLAQEQKQPAKNNEAEEIIGTIERLDPRFDRLIPKDAKLAKIAEGCIWTEGAVWYKPDKCLLFSDIPNNVVIKWEPGKGTSEYLKPSGYTGLKPRGGKAGDEPGSNGLFVDSEGRLHLCEHGDRRVTRIEKDGKKTVLADNYMGKKLNSPNDLALHPNGDIYFTDPPYGLAKGDKRELDFTGVFRINGKDGTLSVVSKSLNPNGIALSPDLKKLYVTQEALCDQWWLVVGFSRQRGWHNRRRQAFRESQAVETRSCQRWRHRRHEVRCRREYLCHGPRRCLRHRSGRHPPGTLPYRRPHRELVLRRRRWTDVVRMRQSPHWHGADHNQGNRLVTGVSPDTPQSKGPRRANFPRRRHFSPSTITTQMSRSHSRARS